MLIWLLSQTRNDFFILFIPIDQYNRVWLQREIKYQPEELQSYHQYDDDMNNKQSITSEIESMKPNSSIR